MPAIVIIPPNVLFPDEPTDLGALAEAVRGLSRTDALFWCARLNHFLSHPGDSSFHARQSQIAERFLSTRQQELATVWARRGNYQREHVALLFRSQLLQLSIWIALLAEDRQDDGVTFEEPETRARFIRAAAIAGDLWNNAVFPPNCLDGPTPSDMKRRGIVSLRAGAAASRQREPLHITLARGRTFYGSDFLACFPTAESDFEVATGLSIREYISCAAWLVISKQADGDSPSLDDPPMHNVADRSGISTKASNVLTKYLRCAGQTPTELANELKGSTAQPFSGESVLSLRRLREKPFIVTADGRAIAIDPQFAQDKVTLGPLFELARIRGQQAFSAFGHTVENYVQRLARAATPDSNVLAERVICNPKNGTVGNEREYADVLWQLDGNSFCLLEVKASFLPEAAIQDGDPAMYITALRSKYSSPQKGLSRALGTHQLARTVRAIGAGEIQIEECSHLAPTIYPVLVVFDRELDGPGHVEVLGADFRAALELGSDNQLPTVLVGRARVRPLVIATVNDFEHLHKSLEQCSLRQILDDYIAWMNGGSLNDFLAYNAKRLGIRESESLVDDALESLEHVRELFFDSEASA